MCSFLLGFSQAITGAVSKSFTSGNRIRKVLPWSSRLINSMRPPLASTAHFTIDRPKPAPDLAQYAMSRLGVSPEESVVIGDSAADIAMGNAAGAHTIQVLWGFTRAPLADAEYSVRTWRELRDAVRALAGPKPILGRGGPLRS